MRIVLPGLGGALAAGSAALMLVACGGSSMLTTASDDTPAAMKTTAQNAATVPVSATVRGSVVDSANQPLANMNIECLGNVHCTLPDSQVSSQGHQHRIAQTDAKGAYEIVASSLP